MKQKSARGRDREHAVSANRTQSRHQKGKDHKSAPKRRAQTANARAKRRADRHKPIPYALKVIDRNLLDRDIPAAKALVLDQICEHGSPTQACLAAGVGRRTFYGWLNESDDTFKRQYIEARRVWRASAIGDVESAFSLRAQYKDTLAGIFLLKHNTKRYREVNRVQLSGPDGGPIVTIDAKEALIDRLEKLIAKAQEKPALAVGDGVSVHEHAGSRGLKVLKGSREGPKVRKARGVSYG